MNLILETIPEQTEVSYTSHKACGLIQSDSNDSVGECVHDFYFGRCTASALVEEKISFA